MEGSKAVQASLEEELGALEQEKELQQEIVQQLNDKLKAARRNLSEAKRELYLQKQLNEELTLAHESKAT